MMSLDSVELGTYAVQCPCCVDVERNENNDIIYRWNNHMEKLTSDRTYLKCPITNENYKALLGKLKARHGRFVNSSNLRLWIIRFIGQYGEHEIRFNDERNTYPVDIRSGDSFIISFSKINNNYEPSYLYNLTVRKGFIIKPSPMSKKIDEGIYRVKHRERYELRKREFHDYREYVVKERVYEEQTRFKWISPMREVNWIPTERTKIIKNHPFKLSEKKESEAKKEVGVWIDEYTKHNSKKKPYLLKNDAIIIDLISTENVGYDWVTYKYDEYIKRVDGLSSGPRKDYRTHIAKIKEYQARRLNVVRG